MTKYSNVEKMLEFTRPITIRTKLHYTDMETADILDLLPRTTQDVHIKPDGIWYSWGDIWLKHLVDQVELDKDSKFDWAIKRVQAIKYVYRLKLDYSNILRLRTFKDLLSFTGTYGIAYDSLSASEKRSYHHCHWTIKTPEELAACKKWCARFKYRQLIDWREVARIFDGIDVRFSKKFDELAYWYNEWDISCGCIWRKEAIKEIKKIY